eukprot:6184045-Pleurochrysis_carterae.AAC.3
MKYLQYCKGYQRIVGLFQARRWRCVWSGLSCRPRKSAHQKMSAGGERRTSSRMCSEPCVSRPCGWLNGRSDGTTVMHSGRGDVAAVHASSTAFCRSSKRSAKQIGASSAFNQASLRLALTHLLLKNREEPGNRGLKHMLRVILTDRVHDHAASCLAKRPRAFSHYYRDVQRGKLRDPLVGGCGAENPLGAAVGPPVQLDFVPAGRNCVVTQAWPSRWKAVLQGLPAASRIADNRSKSRRRENKHGMMLVTRTCTSSRSMAVRRRRSIQQHNVTEIFAMNCCP